MNEERKGKERKREEKKGRMGQVRERNVFVSTHFLFLFLLLPFPPSFPLPRMITIKDKKLTYSKTGGGGGGEVDLVRSDCWKEGEGVKVVVKTHVFSLEVEDGGREGREELMRVLKSNRGRGVKNISFDFFSCVFVFILCYFSHPFLPHSSPRISLQKTKNKSGK